MTIERLTAQQVYRTSSLEQLEPDFKTTKQLTPLNEIVGQERAQQAVEFAMSIKDKGYNIYAVGRNGLGKRTMMQRYLNRHQPMKDQQTFDWCYVANFDDARCPKVLKLPAGTASNLKKEIDKALLYLMKALPQAFDTEVYYTRSEKLKNQLLKKQETALLRLTKEAKSQGVVLIVSAEGDYQLFALNGEEPHDEVSFNQLSDKEKNNFETIIASLEIKLRNILRKLAQWEDEFCDKQDKHNEQVAEKVLIKAFDPLKEQFRLLPQFKAHLNAMHRDMLDNIDIFMEESEELVGLAYASLATKLPRRYQVNVIVSQDDKPFPIVVEESPNYHTIFGYIENATYKGTVFTDFSLIRSGSLHKANGGVLMIDAVKVLERPHVWDGLKRALRSRKLNLSSLERELTLSGTISLEPEPIPLNVKIILFGDYQTYQLLQHYDAEFGELFRVTADFEDEMSRTDSSEENYARFISSIVHDNHMLHCDKSAIARIIEYSSRQAGDQHKLSLHSADIANLLRETNYCARQANARTIRREHVEQALSKQELRVSRLKDSMMQDFANGTLLLETQGKAVGQINALSVLSTTDHQFGIPTRITATTAKGNGEIFDIEHQAKLGGKIHSKGVMILSAYLKSIFAKESKLPFCTHLTFEQSYSGVDGDSASMAELCAIVSAFSQQPLRQDIAITGSMNQFGEAQPIGGVNEKIEGFFDVCQIKGRHKYQGVIIPKTNGHHLMLRQDIVDAIDRGSFHIWAINHVTEALQILTSSQGKESQAPIGENHDVFTVAKQQLSLLAAKSEAKSKGKYCDEDSQD